MSPIELSWTAKNNIFSDCLQLFPLSSVACWLQNPKTDDIKSKNQSLVYILNKINDVFMVFVFLFLCCCQAPEFAHHILVVKV